MFYIRLQDWGRCASKRLPMTFKVTKSRDRNQSHANTPYSSAANGLLRRLVFGNYITNRNSQSEDVK